MKDSNNNYDLRILQDNCHEAEYHRRSKDYEDYEWEKNIRLECNMKCNLQKGA